MQITLFSVSDSTCTCSVYLLCIHTYLKLSRRLVKYSKLRSAECELDTQYVQGDNDAIIIIYFGIFMQDGGDMEYSKSTKPSILNKTHPIRHYISKLTVFNFAFQRRFQNQYNTFSSLHHVRKCLQHDRKLFVTWTTLLVVIGIGIRINR